jgi:hypothetical protein
MGFPGTIEKHSAVVVKRMNQSLRNVPGDGRNKVQHIPDPVLDMEPVTLELNAAANAALLARARAMLEQQRLDPSTAQPLKLYSYLPNSTVVDEASCILARIEEVHTPEGDTNSHALATGKIVVQPLSMGPG